MCPVARNECVHEIVKRTSGQGGSCSDDDRLRDSPGQAINNYVVCLSLLDLRTTEVQLSAVKTQLVRNFMKIPLPIYFLQNAFFISGFLGIFFAVALRTLYVQFQMK